MPRRANPRKRLERSDWIHAGVELLAAKGVEAVCVEVLAKHLRISKGSFYWHFRDREDLLEAILTEWEIEQTAWVSDPMEAYTSPAESWAKFLELISHFGNGQIDVAIFSWAREDRGVARRVAEIEKRRIAYLKRVFGEIGFSSSQAEEWAQAVLLVYLGWIDRSTRDGSYRDGGPPLADVLSRFVLAASALAAQEALRP